MYLLLDFLVLERPYYLKKCKRLSSPGISLKAIMTVKLWLRTWLMKFSRRTTCTKKHMYVANNIETASHLARVVQQRVFLVCVAGLTCVIN